MLYDPPWLSSSDWKLVSGREQRHFLLLHSTRDRKRESSGGGGQADRPGWLGHRKTNFLRSPGRAVCPRGCGMEEAVVAIGVSKGRVPAEACRRVAVFSTYFPLCPRIPGSLNERHFRLFCAPCSLPCSPLIKRGSSSFLLLFPLFSSSSAVLMTIIAFFPFPPLFLQLFDKE